MREIARYELSADESIVRAFITEEEKTMVNPWREASEKFGQMFPPKQAPRIPGKPLEILIPLNYDTKYEIRSNDYVRDFVTELKSKSKIPAAYGEAFALHMAEKLSFFEPRCKPGMQPLYD